MVFPSVGCMYLTHLHFIFPSFLSYKTWTRLFQRMHRHGLTSERLHSAGSQSFTSAQVAYLLL